MTAFHSYRFVATLGAACLTLPAAVPALAHGATDHARPGGEVITPLQRQVMKDVPGKQVQMITVDYAPGQESTPHVHPGSAFVYVLEGEVVSQLAGKGEVKYRAGDSWYEPPEVPHLVSRNASRTKPARLLVWLVTGENDPILRPLR